MDPLTLLREEHGAILDRLYSIDKRLGWLESSGPEKAPKILSSLLRDSERMWKALSLHFYREEKVLYPILERRLGFDGEPVQVMRKEHAELLEYVKSVRSEITRMIDKHDSIKTWSLVSGLQTLRASLSDHISREERVLFWLAEIRFSGLDRKKMMFDLTQIVKLPEIR